MIMQVHLNVEPKSFLYEFLNSGDPLYSACFLFISSYSGIGYCLMEVSLRLQLHGAIYRPDSFVLMLRYCANLKAIRYESTSLKRIVGD